MIPSSYRTETQALAIRTLYTEGSLQVTNVPTQGTNSTSPGLDGVLSANALARIQGAVLSSATSTIDVSVPGSPEISAADAAYITGMQERLYDSINGFYASKPDLSPFNANNKQTIGGTVQTDANVRDIFLQAIFKYDARYGQRLRLNETENITRFNTGSYQLPNRTSFIKNPWVEATMRVHGTTDINSIDDTSGVYRCKTATRHGLYTGQLISADGAAVNPSPITDTHVLRTVATLTQNSTTSYAAPTTSFYTTTTNHNFVTGQKFVPQNNSIGITGVDTESKFWGWQRDRYIKKLSDTTFELHRNYACTDRINAGYYSNDEFGDNPLNIHQSGEGLYYVSSNTPQTIDGMPILFDARPEGGTNTAISVFQRNIISNVKTDSVNRGVFTTTATILDGIQDGMLTNFNAFSGVTWDGFNDYNYPLYFKKVTTTTFTLHTSPTVLDSTTLWIPGTTSNNDLDAIQLTSGIWTATWLRPHNLIQGQDFRTRNTGSVEFGGQQIASYTYSGSAGGDNYWTLNSTSDNVMDYSRMSINTPTGTGAGATFDIGSTEVIVLGNSFYVKRRGALGSKQVQLFVDPACTIQWGPYEEVTPPVAGTYTVETNTFLANIYFAKVVDSTTVQLYANAELTTAWIPAGTVTAVASGASGNTLHTFNITTYNSPGTGYIQPMFFPKTESYSTISLYKDQALTLPYLLSGGGVIPGVSSVPLGTSGSLSLNDLSLGGIEPLTGQVIIIDNYITTLGCYRMNNTSHYMTWVDSGNSLLPGLLNFSNTTLYPAYYLNKISNTEFDLFIDATLETGVTLPVITTEGATSTPGAMKASIFQQSGNYRLDKIIGRNIGLLTYFYNDYDAGTTPVNAQQSYTWYTSHYESNGVHDYIVSPPNDNGNWPSISTSEFNNSTAGVYYGHLRPYKSGSSDAAYTGRLGVDPNIYGVTQGSPMVYTLAQPGRFRSPSPILLGIKVQDDVGTFVEDPLAYNGVSWTQGAEGQPDREWPQTIQPSSMTWTIEQPTQVLETVNLTRYTRTRDVSQYRFKLTYPQMTASQFQVFGAAIHAAGGAYKPFRFWFPRNSANLPMTVSMQNKSVQTPDNFFVRQGLTAGASVILVDGLPPNKTENDPALSAGAGLNMRISNAMGSMMVPISNVRTNEYGEANIRISNGIPSAIDWGQYMDSYILYADVFLDGNSIDIKVDTRGFHYLEVDMITKRVF